MDWQQSDTFLFFHFFENLQFNKLLTFEILNGVLNLDTCIRPYFMYNRSSNLIPFEFVRLNSIQLKLNYHSFCLWWKVSVAFFLLKFVLLSMPSINLISLTSRKKHENLQTHQKLNTNAFKQRKCVSKSTQ